MPDHPESLPPVGSPEQLDRSILETLLPERAVSRRSLLGAAAGFVSTLALRSPARASQGKPDPLPAPSATHPRVERAYRHRVKAAEALRAQPVAPPTANLDEAELPDYLASFTKALPHDRLGIVDPSAYQVLLAALESGAPESYETVPLGGYARLGNPQAAHSMDLLGPEPSQLATPPAPRFASAESAGEMVELYWHALLRDVPFTAYDSHPLVARACEDLSRLSDFRGPKWQGVVTPDTLFRGVSTGDLVGPYVSQFLWKRIPYLPTWIDQAMRTCVPGVDYLDRVDRWLAIQNGALGGPNRFEERPLYVRNGRDLGEYVHRDFSYQAYLSACLMLFNFGIPPDGGNPYKHSRTQAPFATFGQPYVLYLLAVVTQLAFRASWYQKWQVHRRLRPEEMAGRVHHHLAANARYPLHDDLLQSPVLALTEERQENLLLCGAYPEGSPIHPSYPAAHAVIAGACVTVLKAFFDESYSVPEPVEATPDGRALRPFQGPPLAVGDELDKLASNISIGRDFAGVHYRSDAAAGLVLGEELALNVLSEARGTGNELFTGFSVRRFDGQRVDV
jgi:hypothetical protein